MPEKIQTVTESVGMAVNYVDWEKITNVKKLEYCHMLDEKLHDIALELVSFSCSINKCPNRKHKKRIGALYDQVIKIIQESSDNTLLTRSYQNRKRLPGWNDHVREQHNNAVEAYKMWRQLGNPNIGLEYDLMQSTHKTYKKSVKYIKRNEEEILKTRLANKLLNGNPKHFWSDIKKNSTTKIRTACLEGLDNDSDICNFWRTHYNDIFNCVGRGKTSQLSFQYNETVHFSPTEVLNCINSLKTGKSPGPDNLTAEHLNMVVES